jgi:O-acetyl-ADP-ribose deacetylase (regulator of RNase III)
LAGGSHGKAELLGDSYKSSLRLAVSKQLKTVAFPSISTGVYAYPIEGASRIALKTVKQFLIDENQLEEVIFVLFTKFDFGVYIDAANEIL